MYDVCMCVRVCVCTKLKRYERNSTANMSIGARIRRAQRRRFLQILASPFLQWRNFQRLSQRTKVGVLQCESCALFGRDAKKKRQTLIAQTHLYHTLDR